MTSDTNAQVLSVQGYSLDYRTAKGPFHALKDINLSIGAGEIVGLVGKADRANLPLPGRSCAFCRATPARFPVPFTLMVRI